MSNSTELEEDLVEERPHEGRGRGHRGEGLVEEGGDRWHGNWESGRGHGDRGEGGRHHGRGEEGAESNVTEDPYAINYDDERFAQVESDKREALTNIENTYNGMIDKSDDYFQSQIDATKEFADKQAQLQQEQIDFAIDQIEQQKDLAHKDYIKEQSGAYKDWKRESNAYGVEAEQRAAQGLANTGFSESSQVRMYTTYQNRVASARESYTRAVQNYNNSINQAILSNNSALAEIAFNALQTELSLALQGFQYKNELVLGLANAKLQIDSTYYSRWQDVLNQMNTENSLAEQIRQFNESLALEASYSDSYSGGYSSGGGGSGTVSHATWLANLSNSDRAAYEESLKNKNDGKLTGNDTPVRSDVVKHGGVVMTPWGTK